MKGTVCVLVVVYALFSLAIQLTAAEQDDTEPLFPALADGKYGYINQTGTLVIAPQFTSASGFSEGFACVGDAQGGPHALTFINRRGEMLLPPQFSSCGKFSDGLGAVAVDTPKTVRACMDCDLFYHWGYINASGAMVIQPQFHHVEEFSEGLAAVENDAGKWGFIDKTGRTVFEFQYDYASSFTEGVAIVVMHKRYGYIDHTGRAVIRPEFRQALRFSDGLAPVRMSGRFAPPPPSLLSVGSGDEIEEHARWAYIDKRGRAKFRLEAEYVGEFSEGLAKFGIVKADGHLYCGFMDRYGKPVIQAMFGDCDEFSGGFALVLLEGKWHFIDKTGHFVLDPPFVQVRSFHNGLAFFLDGQSPSSASSSGYIDKTGKVVWPRQQ